MKDISTTVPDKMLKEIDQLMIREEGMWSSRSHFVRCAIIKLLRENRK